MEKLTRLNWFKKVFGGVAALCAWPIASAAKPVRKLGYELPNAPNLTAAEKAALIRENAHDDDLAERYQSGDWEWRRMQEFWFEYMKKTGRI